MERIHGREYKDDPTCTKRSNNGCVGTCHRHITDDGYYRLDSRSGGVCCGTGCIVRSNGDMISQSGRRNFSAAADRGLGQEVFFSVEAWQPGVYNICKDWISLNIPQSCVIRTVNLPVR